MLADDQIAHDAFTRMADDIECPRCGKTGFELTWKKPNRPPLGGTTLGHDRTPHLKCRGCGAGVDENVPR